MASIAGVDFISLAGNISLREGQPTDTLAAVKSGYEAVR